MNKEAKTISRRDFLKGFPRQLMKSMQFIAGRHLSDFSLEQNSSQDKEKVSIESKRALLYIERCLAWSGASCQLCYLACPLRDKAIEMIDQKPVVIVSFCNGCGVCVTACQTVNDMPAIKIRGLSLTKESQNQENHNG